MQENATTHDRSPIISDMAAGWYVRYFGWIPKPARRVIVGVIGGTLLLLALVGMVMPIVPGVIFIPLALAILAAEFAWAARWLHQLKKGAANAQERVKKSWYGRWWRKLWPAYAAKAANVQRRNTRQARK